MKYSWSQWNTTPRILLYLWLSHQHPISWIQQLHHDLGCSLLIDVSRTSWVFPLQKWCPSWLWSFQEVFHSVHQLCYIASTCSAKLTFDLCIMRLNIICQDTHISPGDTIQGQVSATIHFVSPYVQESKAVLDSLASTPWIPDPRCWILDSLSLKQSLEGFWIPWAVFPIPKPRILDSTAKTYWFWIPQAKICLILESGLLLTWGDLCDMRIFKKIFVPNTQFFLCNKSH